MLKPNPGKDLSVSVAGKIYNRYPVKTEFIKPGHNLSKVIEKYVLPLTKQGDIIVLGEKIVSLSQNRVIFKKDLKLGFWARFLSKFVKKTSAGFSVGNPLKMQIAINLAGLWRIILASIVAGLGKIFGIRGLFYKIAGNKISQIDGFYGRFFPEYSEIGILSAINASELCQKLSNIYGFAFAIVDINDLGGNIVGISDTLQGKNSLLLEILKDNPAGQANEQTPIIIIRKS